MKQWTGLFKAASVIVAVSMVGCSSMGSMGSAASAFDQLGGMNSVKQLSSGLVNSSLKDPRLSGLTAGRTIDSAAASSKMSDQLCALLGGGCTAPMTSDQISAAASKLTPDQTKALSDNFTSALNSVASNPAVRETVTKALGSKLGGLAGLL